MTESIVAYYESPIGWIYLIGKEGSITSMDFVKEGEKIPPSPVHLPVWMWEAVKQVDEYFNKKRQTFSFSVKPEGTPFQQAVWKALLTVPFGEIQTYQYIVRTMGRTKGARAVGQAIGKNPLLILVPCHRIIGSNGRLTGFTSGLLLTHEGKEV